MFKNKSIKDFYIRATTTQGNQRVNDRSTNSQPPVKKDGEFVMFHIQGYGQNSNQSPNQMRKSQQAFRRNLASQTNTQQEIEKPYENDQNWHEKSRKIVTNQDQNATSVNKNADNKMNDLYRKRQDNENDQNKKLQFYRGKYGIPRTITESGGVQQKGNNQKFINLHDVSDIEIIKYTEEDSFCEIQDLMQSGLELGQSKIQNNLDLQQKMRSEQDLAEENYNMVNGDAKHFLSQKNSARKTLSVYQKQIQDFYSTQNKFVKPKTGFGFNNNNMDKNSDMSKWKKKFKDITDVLETKDTNSYLQSPQSPDQKGIKFGTQQLSQASTTESLTNFRKTTQGDLKQWKFNLNNQNITNHIIKYDNQIVNNNTNQQLFISSNSKINGRQTSHGFNKFNNFKSQQSPIGSLNKNNRYNNFNEIQNQQYFGQQTPINVNFQNIKPELSQQINYNQFKMRKTHSNFMPMKGKIRSNQFNKL